MKSKLSGQSKMRIHAYYPGNLAKEGAKLHRI